MLPGFRGRRTVHLPGQILWILTWIFTQVLADDTGMLASTLFTFQDHACDHDRLKIRCPYGTTISIEWAQYGRRVPSRQMCPAMLEPLWSSEGMQEPNDEDTNCMATTSLQVVLDKCQDQRTCSVQASSSMFRNDPCPGTSKYLEVAYKCRPNEFRSRITCEGDDMMLHCKKARRIVIYSAMFGRSPMGNLECPIRPGQSEIECEAECSYEEVSRRCHGRRRCTISASQSTFGNPCYEGTPKYLQIVYTCVPKRILKDIKKNKDDSDPLTNSICKLDGNHGNGGRHGNQRTTLPPWETADGVIKNPEILFPDDGREGEASYRPEPSTFDYNNFLTPYTRTPHIDRGVHDEHPGDSSSVSDGKYKHDLSDDREDTVTESVDIGAVAVKEDYIGFVNDWIGTYTFIEQNLEKFILYLILGLFGGLILVLLVIIGRLIQTRRHRERKAKLDISEPIPTSASHQRAEDFTMLDNSQDSSTDGIEILSINHNRPPPGYHTDTGNRSMNNYYG